MRGHPDFSFAQLFEAAPDAFLTVDADGVIRYGNAHLKKMFGYAGESLVGRPLALLLPEIGDCVLPTLDGSDLRCRARRRDGSELPVKVRLSKMHTHGKPVTLAIVREADVPEKALDSNNLVHSVIESTTDAIFVKDRDGRYVFINTAGAAVACLPPEEIIGKEDDLLFSPETARQVRENDAMVMGSGKTMTWEEVTVARDGVRRIYWATKAPWRDSTGCMMGVVGIARDITERKRIEEEQRLLADVSDALATSIDLDSTLQRLANLLVPRLADWCFVDLFDEGTFHSTVAHAERGPLETMREIVATYDVPKEPGRAGPRSRVFRTGQAETGEVTDELLSEVIDSPPLLDRLRKMSLRFYASVPLLIRGRPVGVLSLASSKSSRGFGAQDLAVASEIGRRAAMAIDNARLYRQAQRAVVARSDLLAMVSHDLRNPLDVLLLRANVLLAQWSPGSESGRAHVESIQRVANRMAALTGELLDAASLEAGHVLLDCAPCEPRVLVDEVLEQLAPIAERKALRLTADVAPDLPKLSCDRDRLGRVFVNLIDNAIKFTPKEGSITVGAEVREGDIAFAVTDTGPGIPDDQVAHIFERFCQPGGAARGGAGLGLYIAKGIVEAHHGTIAAKSRVGEGTTVQFTIPWST